MQTKIGKQITILNANQLQPLYFSIVVRVNYRTLLRLLDPAQFNNYISNQVKYWFHISDTNWRWVYTNIGQINHLVHIPYKTNTVFTLLLEHSRIIA